jgi:hypothetical protein
MSVVTGPTNWPSFLIGHALGLGTEGMPERRAPKRMSVRQSVDARPASRFGPERHCGLELFAFKRLSGLADLHS